MLFDPRTYVYVKIKFVRKITPLKRPELNFKLILTAYLKPLYELVRIKST